MSSSRLESITTEFCCCSHLFNFSDCNLLKLIIIKQISASFDLTVSFHLRLGVGTDSLLFSRQILFSTTRVGHRVQFLTEQVSVVVTLSICIQDIPGSNRDRISVHPNWGFSRFYSLCPGECWNCTINYATVTSLPVLTHSPFMIIFPYHSTLDNLWN
jgi:hypothetical protein